MVIGDNYQVAVWFVEVLVSRSRLRAGLSGFYCLDDLHLESQARLGVVNSYLRYELVSYTNEHIQGNGIGRSDDQNHCGGACGACVTCLVFGHHPDTFFTRAG